MLLGEQPHWRAARMLSYHCHLGLEESLKRKGVEVTTLMNPFLQQAPELLRGEKFDQVWAEVFVNPHLCDSVCEWMTTVAPIRLGLCAESTEYTEEELHVKPELATMAVRFRKRLPYLTHLALGDEIDPPRLESSSLQTTWLIVSANSSILSETPLPHPMRVRFFGHVYGERKAWLRHPLLTGRMDAAPHAESKAFAFGFDLWRLFWRGYAHLDGPLTPSIQRGYLAGSRRLRFSAATAWQRHLQKAGAVVSLPLIFKSFPGRVVEAMAANRPVLCWQVPDRPRMLEVFEHGKEILFYQTPEELAEGIDRVQNDPRIAERMAAAAYRKLLAEHTTEHRVGGLLEWLSG